MYFTERSYYHAPEDEIIRNRGFFGLPNRFHDAQKASDLYHMYLDEAVYAEEMGFDAIMLNEHHGTPYCMGSVMDVEAAILARITSRIKIVLLGNPLPVVRNPIRLAEELAEIDLISRGRLVAGWVRGAGSEQLFNNVSPALNRELFNEAHDLVIKCWTQPGPFRFEGKHFHFRFVNPWALPYQKPHPPVWIPGLLSPESVLWAAEHRYPYFGFGGGLDKTAELQEMYADKAAELGYQAGPENFGYLQNVLVAETDAQAQELGRQYLWGGGGQAAVGTRARLARGELDIEAARQALYAPYQEAQKNYQIVVGCPKTVIAKCRKTLEVLRPSLYAISQPGGPLTHEQRMTSIRLFGQEVAPALREIARSLGLVNSYQVKPGSRPLPPSGKRAPVSNAAALTS